MILVDRGERRSQWSVLRFLSSRGAAALWALLGRAPGGAATPEPTLLSLDEADLAQPLPGGTAADPSGDAPDGNDGAMPLPPVSESRLAERVSPAGPDPSPARDAFQIVEAERMRIARDIHDGPAQLMANLVLKAEIVEKLFARDPESALAELAEFRSTARVALEETRRLIFDLRPMALDDLGLVPTLRKLLADLGVRHGTAVGFHLVGSERRLPPDLEASLFRIIQEATTNALRHAEASAVDVTLTIGPGTVKASIRDNGRGFDVAAARAQASRTGRLGLATMRERAALQNGVIDLYSAPHHGTDVRLSISY